MVLVDVRRDEDAMRRSRAQGDGDVGDQSAVLAEHYCAPIRSTSTVNTTRRTSSSAHRHGGDWLGCRGYASPFCAAIRAHARQAENALPFLEERSIWRATCTTIRAPCMRSCGWFTYSSTPEISTVPRAPGERAAARDRAQRRSGAHRVEVRASTSRTREGPGRRAAREPRGARAREALAEHQVLAHALANLATRTSRLTISTSP